ncbi:lactonase family protein [Paenibacillus marinisediminis]
MASQEQRMLVFVGSYADASSDGVYVYEFNEERGELKQLHSVAGLKNPTFLNVDESRRILYAIGETAAEDGSKTSDAISYAIQPTDGTLTEMNRAYALNGPACHIQRSSDNRYLTLTSYHKGSVSLVSLTEEGNVGELLDIQQHDGSSVNRAGDIKPHPHSSFYSPDERYLFVCDLGLDLIRAYKVDQAAGKLVHHGDTVLQPGSGPRHMVFHPNGKFAYVINELDSTFTAFEYDADNGTLNAIETVSTLPEGENVNNSCAEVTISADGNYLYGSNRGHDSIVVYAVDSNTGKLSLVEHVSTQGEHPRHFSILPGGRYLIAANRDTNNMTVFKVDPASGKLAYTGHSVEVSKPVCVWAYLM